MTVRRGRGTGRPPMSGGMKAASVRSAADKRTGTVPITKAGRRQSGRRTKTGARTYPRSRRSGRYKSRRLRTAAPKRFGTVRLNPEKDNDLRESAFHEGYELGRYEGGEQLLELSQPHNALLPEVSLQQFIAAGVGVFREQCYPLMDVHEVYAEIVRAMDEGRPCAVVRLGDGELLALAQDIVYDAATIEREGRFLPYAGVVPPDIAARDQLALAIKYSQIVGVPLSRKKNFQPLLYPALRGHGIDPGALRMTVSTINYSLQLAGLLAMLLRGRRLLLIGNAAPELARVLSEGGCDVSGVISPVRGFPDIERVLAEARNVRFDLALVSAGIPAVVICWRIAAERGKAALDFGHMADMIVKGAISLFP